jgi:hypothetical protein
VIVVSHGVHIYLTSTAKYVDTEHHTLDSLSEQLKIMMFSVTEQCSSIAIESRGWEGWGKCKSVNEDP